MKKTDTATQGDIKKSLRLLRSDDPQQRMKGIGGLAALHDDPRVSQVFEHLYESDPDPRVRRAAWHALYQNGPSVPAPRPVPEPAQPPPVSRSPAPRKRADGVFLLDSTNKALIARIQRQDARRRRSGRLPLAIAVALVALAAVLWVQVWPDLLDWFRLRQSGITVGGTVTALHSDGGRYRVVYRFDTAHDVETIAQTSEQSVTSDAYNRMQVDDRVSVTYWPDDPAVAQIDAVNPDHVQRDRQALAAMALGVIALLFASLGLVWRQAGHRPDPRIVPGRIVACQGRVDADGDYKLAVRYRFTSPASGKPVNGQQRQIRNDLRKSAPPEAGTPVMVAYRSDRQHRLL